MAEGLIPLLERRLSALRKTREYQDLLAMVTTMCRQTEGAPEQTLAAVADAIVRPIASDLSAGTPGKIVILHMGVVAR